MSERISSSATFALGLVATIGASACHSVGGERAKSAEAPNICHATMGTPVEGFDKLNPDNPQFRSDFGCALKQITCDMTAREKIAACTNDSAMAKAMYEREMQKCYVEGDKCDKTEGVTRGQGREKEKLRRASFSPNSIAEGIAECELERAGDLCIKGVIGMACMDAGKKVGKILKSLGTDKCTDGENVYPAGNPALTTDSKELVDHLDHQHGYGPMVELAYATAECQDRGVGQLHRQPALYVNHNLNLKPQTACVDSSGKFFRLHGGQELPDPASFSSVDVKGYKDVL